MSLNFYLHPCGDLADFSVYRSEHILVWVSCSAKAASRALSSISSQLPTKYSNPEPVPPPPPNLPPTHNRSSLRKVRALRAQLEETDNQLEEAERCAKVVVARALDGGGSDVTGGILRAEEGLFHELQAARDELSALKAVRRELEGQVGWCSIFRDGGEWRRGEGVVASQLYHRRVLFFGFIYPTSPPLYLLVCCFFSRGVERWHSLAS